VKKSGSWDLEKSFGGGMFAALRFTSKREERRRKKIKIFL
jgi:hypothetical protein